MVIAAAISPKLNFLNSEKNFTEKEPAYILFHLSCFVQTQNLCYRFWEYRNKLKRVGNLA